MLMLGYKAAVFGYVGPAIALFRGKGGIGRNECFQRYNRVLAELAPVVAIVIAGYLMRSLMQTAPYSMAYQVSDYLQPSFPRLSFYQPAYIGNADTVFLCC